MKLYISVEFIELSLIVKLSWLLILVAAVDCCCWLLLLIADTGCCCWLLLLLIADTGCCCWLLLLVAAAQKVFEYFRDIVDDLRLRQFAGEKVFEYFRVVDELRLRQFCRRKSLWTFSGADEKSLNISRILMGEKWKRGSPRGSRLEGEWMLWLCAGYLYLNFQDGRRLSESQ